jgi:hypothetical protein
MLSLPNFLVIGAAKAGTTSLWWYMNQHPQIFLAPIKEPRYFAYADEKVAYIGPGDDAKWNQQIISRWDAYTALFQMANGRPAIGEASNVYLYLAEKTAGRIADALPCVRLLTVLRHPVDRAYSNFLMLRGEGREPLREFRDACAAEPYRLSKGWSPGWAYIRRSRYADSIRIFQSRFPASRMRFFLYDDFVRDPQGMMDAIFKFLDVDPFAPDMQLRHNVSSLPRFRWLAYGLRHTTPASKILRRLIPGSWRERLKCQLMGFNNRPSVRLDAATRMEFTDLFRDDILRTQDLIQRDLSHWLAT